MKFLKGLLVFLLLIIIIGGVGFLAYNLYFNNMTFDMGMNMSSDTTGNNTSDNSANQSTDNNTTENNTNDTMDMSGMNNATGNMNQTAAIPNPQYAKNREKLSEAIVMINQALDQITLDPYSKATVSDNSSMQMNKSQSSQGTGTINIYPSDNSSVNILPDTTNQDANTTQSDMAGMNMNDVMQDTADNKYVYDQSKLQQLHSGIYTIAQGILAINELNDSLLEQSMALEQQPFTYQTYVLRYNNSLTNERDLENAMTLLNSASVLINVNPYASDSGYSYDMDSLKQLHEGVYKFAQGMAILESLKEDFISQMSAASMSAQNLVTNTTQMNMSSSDTGIFNNLSLNTIFNIIIVVMIIGLIIGLLGSILSLFKHKPQMNS